MLSCFYKGRIALVSAATHTCGDGRARALARVDDGFIGRLKKEGLESWHADALHGTRLAPALINHLHLPQPLEQQDALHSHCSRLAHRPRRAGRLQTGSRGQLGGRAFTQLGKRNREAYSVLNL